MTNDSTIALKTRRIAGTLHKREHASPAPLRDENLPREGVQDSEVAESYKNSGQQDHKAAS